MTRPVIAARLDTFHAEYTRRLAAAVAEYPDQYRYSLADVPTVAARMRDAIARESFNKEGHAMAATCKALGIPYTYEGIRTFLTTE